MAQNRRVHATTLAASQAAARLAKISVEYARCNVRESLEGILSLGHRKVRLAWRIHWRHPRKLAVKERRVIITLYVRLEWWLQLSPVHVVPIEVTEEWVCLQFSGIFDASSESRLDVSLQ